MRFYISLLFLILLVLAFITPSPKEFSHVRYYHVAAATQGDKTVWQYQGPAYQVCVQVTHGHWECH